MIKWSEHYLGAYVANEQGLILYLTDKGGYWEWRIETPKNNHIQLEETGRAPYRDLAEAEIKAYLLGILNND